MVTEAEKELIKLLTKIDNDENCIIGTCLVARENKMTEKCVSFIEENPNMNYDDIISFMLDGDCFEGI